MTPGSVFRLADDTVEGGHPWVVLAGPFGHPPKLVIGNFTALDADKDQSCVVRPASEPCLTKESVFSYRDTRVELLSAIESHVASGAITLKGTLQTETLNQIYEGVSVTRFIPNDPYEALDSLGLIPFV